MSTAPRSARLLTASLFPLCAWLAQPPLATAQHPLGGEFRINSYTIGKQEEPAVARNAQGEFLVVWQSKNLGGYAILGQGYDAAGAPIGSEFRVEPIRPNSVLPSVAADADGNFIVAFNHSNGSVVQKYDVSGTALGDPIDLAGSSALAFSPSGGPDVASAADGSFVVAWEAWDNHGYGILGRRFDSSGNPLTGEFRVNASQYGTQRVPEVASAPNGDFAVVWWEWYRTATFATRFDASGNAVSGEFLVKDNTAYADIAPGEDESVVVVWSKPSLPQGGHYAISGRRFGPSGEPLGSELEISTATSNSSSPRVASDADGDFVVVWRDSDAVLAREFDADGTPHEDPFQVNTYTSDLSGRPAIASDLEGNYVVVWERNDGWYDGIFGQRFAGPDLHLSVDGTCPGPVTASIVNAPPNSEVALIAAANTNGFVKGGTLCNGVELEIGEPFQLPPGFVIVDGEGKGETALELGAGRCFVQALALASCETSNVVVVP
jgi:hypothetical protein